MYRICFSILVLVIASALESNAQTPNWRKFGGTTLVKFNWSCATQAAYPSAKLRRVVDRAMKQQEFGGFGSWVDRVCAFDL